MTSTPQQAAAAVSDDAAPAYRPRLTRDPAGQRERRTLRLGPAASAALAARLTARDRWLLRMLLEHRVLTTTQITQLAFTGHRAATARQRTLHQLGVLDRFRPYTAIGSAPLHYTLAPLGAHLLATDHGTTVDALGYQPDRLTRLAVALTLAHDVGANGVFTALVAHARSRRSTGRLTTWWSEPRCRTVWDGVIRPDGYGRWHPTDDDGDPVPGNSSAEVDFFLEYENTGAQHPDRVAAKLAGYDHLAADSGLVTPVLFRLPDQRTETRLHAALDVWLRDNPGAAARVPAATTHGGLAPAAPSSTRIAEAPPGPAGPVWLPVAEAARAAGLTGYTGHRLTLADLRRLTPPAQSGTGDQGTMHGQGSEPPADLTSTGGIAAPDPMPPDDPQPPARYRHPEAAAGEAWNG